ILTKEHLVLIALEAHDAFLDSLGLASRSCGVKLELGSDLLIDLAQEGQPLLMAMARSGVGKYLAGKVVQGGKEGHRSMAIVVVGQGANVSLAQRQARLGAFEGLALALFITAEHQGPIRRIEVKAHHIPKLFLKPKVLGELEIAHP